MASRANRDGGFCVMTDKNLDSFEIFITRRAVTDQEIQNVGQNLYAITQQPTTIYFDRIDSIYRVCFKDSPPPTDLDRWVWIFNYNGPTATQAPQAPQATQAPLGSQISQAAQAIPAHQSHQSNNTGTKVKRPANCWILYRKQKSREIHQENPDLTAKDISSIVSDMWRQESELVRGYYQVLADEVARRHKLQHPDYKYSPSASSGKRDREESSDTFGSELPSSKKGRYCTDDEDEEEDLTSDSEFADDDDMTENNFTDEDVPTEHSDVQELDKEISDDQLFD